MKNLKQLTFVSALIAAAGLGAQENYGTIVGTVRDPNRNPVAGATISISGPQLLGSRSVLTDAQGRYRLQIVLPGQYTVRVSMQGFIGSQSGVMLTGGSTLSVDLNLRPISVQEEVVEIVATDNPVIDKTETKVATTFTAEELSNLNTGGMVGVWAAAYMAPGVQQADVGYDRMRGGMVGSTQYMINGMMTRDPATGQGRQAEFIIEDLIQDVQVIQNPINAKYGFTQSGIIAVNSRTGTNEFKGSVRLRLRNNTWYTYTGNFGPVQNRWNEVESGSSSREPNIAWGQNPLSDRMARQYDITLSGPIIKDKLTFSYGAAIRPSSLVIAGNRFNPLNEIPLNNNLYLPGLTLNDPKYTGPDPTDGNIMKENWAAWYWGGNPQNPTEPRNITTRSSEDMHSFKFFYQLNPNHQIEFNYTSAKSTSGFQRQMGAWVADGDNIISGQSYTKHFNRGLSYRGIIGNSGVLTAQYASTESSVDIGGGSLSPDPMYIQFYGNAQPSLTTRPQTGWSRPAMESYNLQTENRSNITYRLDYNHIWENHNIDVGFQMLESMNDRLGYGGPNGQVIYILGRQYDGNYLVWNSVHQGGPLWEPNRGVESADFPYQGGTYNTHREFLFNNYFVSSLQDYNTYGFEGGTAVSNTTTAFYANDNWTLNDKWAINLGLRVTNNKLEDAMGERLNATGIEPRFRVQYDMFGDNQHVFAFSATQKGGIITAANVGAYSISRDSQQRRFLWNQDNPNPGQQAWEPYFVTIGEIRNPANYDYYWSYSNSAINRFIDKDIKPQQTTEFEVNYRRAFGMGGYFRIALVYNYLSNALTSYLLDEAVEMVDPLGREPSTGFGNTRMPKYYLGNDSSRSRHYASAELEWMRPLINRASYRLNWNGNWTIAKTTGNSMFSAAGSLSGSGAGEADANRFWEQAIAFGIPDDLMDPWGEINTPRHSVKTWFTFTHGERGGVNNTVTLMAAYSSGSPQVLQRTYNFVGSPFQNATANGGLVTGFASNIPLYPYGFGYRTNSSSYQTSLQYNLTIPITKRVSMFAEISVVNPFNNIVKGDVLTSWTNPALNWTRDGAALTDPMWGRQFANRTYGQSFGVHSISGERRFTDGSSFLVATGLRF